MRPRLLPSETDEHRALAVAADLARCHTRERLTELVLGLTDLVPADAAFVATDAGFRPGAPHTFAVAGTTNTPEIYDRRVMDVVSTRWREQPLVVRQLRGPVDRPEMITDHLTPQEWHRSTLYNEAYRRMGMEHELALHISWSRKRIECVSLNRRRGATPFGERDRTVLELVLPHIRAARDRVRVLDAQRERIAALQGHPSRAGQPASLAGCDTTALALLTPRQAEVAALLVAGCTGRQIAAHLQIGARTADTHIEHIYRRLGARNRAQAVAVLLGCVSPGN